MRITIHGAGNEVTGSCYLVETERASVLVDCGQFQGGKRDAGRNTLPKSLVPRDLNAVLVSHGHLDHVGRLPLLTKRGFRGSIYATPATIEVARLILKDSAKIQESEAERANRKRMRAGLQPVSPLYTDDDVDAMMPHCRASEYGKSTPIAPGISIRMFESGHILGSALIEMTIEESGSQKVVVFTGDLGPAGMPILKDPIALSHADWVFMESTYGDRDHRPLSETVEEFHTLLREAVTRKGKVLVPTFALGRTQQILYHLAKAFSEGVVPPFPVYIDSPLGIAATEVYARHKELYDDDMREFMSGTKYDNAIKTVQFCQTADESKALNDVKGTCLIMAGSGMCNAGRILHHLKHNLWRDGTTVIFVGYQAPGTLGRMLIEGKDRVNVFGEPIAVRATIRSLGGFSAHAGQGDLLKWYGSLAPAKPKTMLIHGEDRARKPLARVIKERWGIDAVLPCTGDIIQ